MNGFLKSAGLAMLFAVGPVSALPYLQLDVSPGGIYNTTTEDSVSTTNPFTLWGLVDNGGTTTSTEDFRVSIALLFNGKSISKTVSGPDFGDFTVDGASITNWASQYGTPPLDSLFKDIGGHGIYDTYFWEIDVAGLEGVVPAYNAEDNAGDPGTATNCISPQCTKPSV